MTVLLVAATGGHLAQLDRLASRIPGFDEDAVWVTFDSPQSRSLLETRKRLFVRYTASRDLWTALRNTRVAASIIRDTRPSLVVSTGNAIAVSFLPVARLAGIPAAYIESAARAEGPSLTGRILRTIPGMQLFTQYRDWASPPWQYAGSVFDDFASVRSTNDAPVRRILVTLGTIRFGFRALVERVLDILPSRCEVIWQVGNTDVAGLGIHSRASMPDRQLRAEMARADVVIAHAGIGSALASLEAGKCPVLVPRERSRGEHVDDHQAQIARALDTRGLALHRPVESLSAADLKSASERSVVQQPHPEPLGIAV